MKRGKEKKKEEIGKQCSRDRAFYYCEHCGLLQLVELGCKSFALLMRLCLFVLSTRKKKPCAFDPPVTRPFSFFSFPPFSPLFPFYFSSSIVFYWSFSYFLIADMMWGRHREIMKERDGWRGTQRGEGSFQLKEEIDEKQRFAALLTLIEMSIVNLSYM